MPDFETSPSINATSTAAAPAPERAATQGLGISSPVRHQQQHRQQHNDPADVLAFAKRLLGSDGDAGGATAAPPSSPPTLAPAAAVFGVQRSVSSGKRPLFTRDHSRTSSSGSIRSQRNRREDADSEGLHASTSSSAGPSSPTGGISNAGSGEGSPRKLKLLASSMGRKQTTWATVSEEKKALAKLVTMYENLSQQFTDMQTQQSDLETNLKIARSNLVLAENHAEVLEDAIKRNSMQRMSNGNASPITGPSVHPFHGSRPTSVVSQGAGAGSSGLQRNSTMKSPNPSAANLSAADAENDRDSPSTQAPSPRLGGFWRRRPTVGAGSAPNLNGSVIGGTGSGKGKERMSIEGSPSDMTSAEKQHESLMRKPSFGMLRSSSANVPGSDKERTQAAQILQLQSQISQLQHQYSLLSTEHASLREAHSGLNQKYTSLQEEIENLSVSLFEEANTMVAEERRVNSFLNQQLEKAKEEVEDLQQQLDELRQAAVLRQSASAFSASSGPSRKASLRDGSIDAHTRRPSDTSSISVSRSRTGTASSHRRSISSMNHKRRRSSTIPSLDAIDALVSASPRRASRDMAAAAAAVKALATRERERESLDMPRLPATASVSSFQQLTDVDEERGDDMKARSAPSSATHQQHSYSHQREWSASQQSGTEDDTASSTAGAESGRTSRSKWFSFGSLKRKSPALASDVTALSPAMPSPNPSIISDTNTVLDHGAPPRSPPIPPRSPKRESKSRFSVMQQTEPLVRLPRSPSSRSIAESIIPLPVSPPAHQRSRTTSNRPHLRHASSSSSRLQSPPASARPTTSTSSRESEDSAGTRSVQQLHPLSESRASPMKEAGSSPRDRFFAAAGPLAALKDEAEAQTGRDRADTSQSSQFASMTDLHSLLDEVANDIDLDIQKQAETLNGPLPFSNDSEGVKRYVRPPMFSTRGSSSASVRTTRRPISWRKDGASPTKLSQASLSPTRSGPISPPLQDGDISPTSSLPGQTIDSPELAAPHSPPTLRPRRLRPIDTSAIRTGVPGGTSALADEAGPEPSSPFPLPTPPPFKRFPSSNSYQAPLSSELPGPEARLSPKRPPTSASLRSTAPSSHSLARKDSLGAGGLPSASSTSSSLNRFWDSRKLGTFGLQRQNSTLSAAGSSVVDDLDTLMQSIDAMNESLGLEDDPVDPPLPEGEMGEQTIRTSGSERRLGDY